MSVGPPEREVKDFRFNQLCKVRVSEPLEIRTDRSQWLAASHKFDLVFICVKDGFKVFKLSEICRIDEENARDRSTHIVEDFPVWAGVSLSCPISHLILSCDELTLALVVKECGNLTLCMYDVRQFAAKTNSAVAFARSRLNASPGASLQDIAWNPVDPTLAAVCVSDGSVELVRVTDKIQTVGTLPVSSNVCCFCWSPKGRQLVVGKKDGTMTQFDQEMNEKRKWPHPTILENCHQVVDVMWLSTYVFMAAYLPSTAESSDQPIVILTVSSKDGPTSYVNFEDVCYGSGEDRKHKYFFTFLAKWDLVLLSSSNATETMAIAKHLDQAPGSGQWEHWTLEDSGRADLPLTDNHLDSFPVGSAVSLSCQTAVKLGETKSIPPCPVMLLLSTDGLLVPYYVMYLNPKAPVLTVSPELLTLEGARTSSGTTESNPSSTAGLPTTMTGFQLGAPKPSPLGTSLGQSSTLPTTGSSFQFVQKPTQPIPTAPGSSLPSQPLTSSLPTTGNSFQFVAKPPQPLSTQPGHNLFTPVGSQATSVPGSQKSGTSYSFTPSTPKQPPSTTTAPSGGQVGKNLFAAPSPGSSAFTSSASGAAKTTAPAFGFSTEAANTTAPTFGFGMTAAKTTASAGFNSDSSKTTASSGFSLAASNTGTGTVFGGAPAFSKPPAAVTSTAASTTAATSTFGGFSFAQKEQTTFGGSSKPAAVAGGFSGLSGMSQTVTTTTPGPTPAKTSQTNTATATQLAGKGDELPTPTYPVSRPAAPPTLPPAYPGSRPAVPPTLPPAYPGSRPAAQYLPATSTPVTNVVAGVKRDIEEETGQSSPPPPPPPPSQSLEKQWVNETVESTFTRSILEEMHHFEQELRQLKSRAGTRPSQVGTRDEMQELRKTTMEMSKFCEGIKETTREQSREVNDQKVLCMDLFAMSEECRVRQERNDDPHYHQLLRSRALDPASAEKLKQLQTQHQVLEQGLSEVELILDQQWEDYQDKKKAVRGRLQAPTSDMVYRTVKSNHNLIQTQKSHLEKLQDKLKNLQLYNQSSDWQNNSTYSPNTSRSTDLTSLIESFGQGSPRPIRSSTMICGSPGKKAQLRDFLSQRAVPRVKSTKPGNLSMSQIVAAKGLREKLEEVRSRPSTRTPPGSDTDQTVPLQLAGRPNVGLSQQVRGNMKIPSPSGGPAGFGRGREAQTELVRGSQNMTSGFPGNRTGFVSLPRGEAGDSLESSTNSFGKGVSSEELTSAMLRAKEVMNVSHRPDLEDISPAFTPELASDEQEGFTEEDEQGEYDDEEEEEDEEEAGFGPEYSLDITGNGMKRQEDSKASATPLSSLMAATSPDKKASVGKNLFGTSTAQSSASPSQPTSGLQTESTRGFAFSTETGKSGFGSEPRFGSGSVTPVKIADVTSSSQDAGAAKPETKGFSFSTKPSTGDNTSSAGFSFAMPPPNTSTDSGGSTGYKFGAESGIFSKSSDSTKQPGSSFTAFGGGSFGGAGEVSSTTVSSSSDPAAAAAVTAALSSSLLQALTDSSTSVTSASVTASAALSSSLFAALADASSPAPQEAAAALSSFSFKPGETPSPPSTNTASSALVVSGSAAQTASIAAATTAASTPDTTSTESGKPGLFGVSSAAGGFGQPAKFSGSPPGASTTTTTSTTSASSFGSNAGVFGAGGPAAFGSLSTPTQSTTENTSTTSASVVKTLFGATTSTTAATPAFGSAPTTTTSAIGTTPASTTASGFGSNPTTASASSGSSTIFGGGTGTATTTASMFGQATTTQTTTPSLFGSGTTTTTASSLFGGATSGIFASQAATTTASTSVFGTSSADTTKSGFSFGQNTTGGFGQPGFGQTPGFGQASSFGGSESGSFGSGGSLFGQPAASSSASVLGQTTPATQSSEGGGFGGGGLFGGLGGKPSADKANKNVFGGGTFGTSSNTENSTLFGSGGGPSSFGTASQGGFGTGTGFAVSGSGVGATGFGISQTPQSPQPSSGFGGQPAFGGSPSFGSSTFGGAPAFGSPSGGFGTNASFAQPVSSSTFGSAPGQQAGFASFASSNSPTFGNLAQSNPPSFGGVTQEGGGGGGAFGSPAGFGNPDPSGFGAQPGFGNQQSGFGSSPQFTSYRG